MKKRGLFTLLCTSALVFSLAACSPSDADKIPPVEGGYAAPVEQEAGLTDLLAMVESADIDALSWEGPYAPTEEQLAELLRQAAAAPVAPGPEWDQHFGLWTAAFRFLPWDVPVTLSAGLEENIVRVSADDLPDQALYLEHQDLYQRLCAVHDIPLDVDDAIYARSKGLIEHYYDTLLKNLAQLGSGFERWALTTLTPAAERTDLGARSYVMSAALYAHSSVHAADQLAGDMVLDSQLRTLGIPEQTVYLVTIDDIPAGILPLRDGVEPADSLADYTDVDDLKSAFWTAWGK